MGDKKRRICFYGGAGSGKSRLAAHIFSELKMRPLSVELITEYVKSWAWQDKKPTSFDQPYITAKQLHYEERILRHGCDLIVTDSPVLLGAVYARQFCHTPDIADGIEKIVMAYESMYPAINIFLDRVGKFDPKGRWGTLEENQKIDKLILSTLERCKIPFVISNWNNGTDILKYILEQI